MVQNPCRVGSANPMPEMRKRPEPRCMELLQRIALVLKACGEGRLFILFTAAPDGAAWHDCPNAFQGAVCRLE